MEYPPPIDFTRSGTSPFKICWKIIAKLSLPAQTFHCLVKHKWPVTGIPAVTFNCYDRQTLPHKIFCWLQRHDFPNGNILYENMSKYIILPPYITKLSWKGSIRSSNSFFKPSITGLSTSIDLPALFIFTLNSLGNELSSALVYYRCRQMINV